MTNSINISPQISDVPSLFQVWRQSHIGNHQDFISFITTPSGERSRFLMTVQVTAALHASLLFNQISTAG